MAALIAYPVKRNGNTRHGPEPSRGSGGVMTTAVQPVVRGTKTIPMPTLIRWDRNLRIHSAFTISRAMSGNGQKNVMPIATQKHRRTAAQRKAQTAACAWIVAVAGCIEAGSSAQLLVKGILPNSATLLWDSASRERCRRLRPYD